MEQLDVAVGVVEWSAGRAAEGGAGGVVETVEVEAEVFEGASAASRMSWKPTVSLRAAWSVAVVPFQVLPVRVADVSASRCSRGILR